MQQGSTRFLKSALIMLGLPVLAACVFFVPTVSNKLLDQGSLNRLLKIPFFIGTFGSAIAYFYALTESWHLLNLIDRNQAFSLRSIKALVHIKFSAVVISIIYLLELPILILIADADDAPGLVLIGLVISLASLLVAVFAAVLQRLLNDAITYKSEIDLTV